MNVEDWNYQHPAGTPVVVSVGGGTHVSTVTAGPAFLVGGVTPVVPLDRFDRPVLLTVVRPVPAGELATSS